MAAQQLNRIMYVEDEPDIQAVARIALEMVGGFEVHVVGSGHAALMEGPEFSPDLIMLDVMMPGMDGPTTLLELRKLPALRDVPVVFMTAKVQPLEIQHYKEIGAIDVIPKPFDPMTLADALRGIWSTLHGNPT